MRQTVGGEHQLGRRLVHCDRGREHAGAHVRHVGQFEKPLHGAVFAVRSVQYREDDIQRQAGDDGAGGLAVDRHQRVAARMRHEVRLAQRLARRTLRRPDHVGRRHERGGLRGSTQRPSFSMRIGTGS